MVARRRIEQYRLFNNLRRGLMLALLLVLGFVTGQHESHSRTKNNNNFRLKAQEQPVQQQNRRLVDQANPKRVRIRAFSLTLTPTPSKINIYQARRIRDVAESIFVRTLRLHPWDPATTFFDYAGLFGVDAITWDTHLTPPQTILHVNGGLVVFEGESTAVPTQDELESMLLSSLYPSNGQEGGLVPTLNTNPMFQGITDSSLSYQAEPSSPPSMIPSQSPSMTPPRKDDIQEVATVEEGPQGATLRAKSDEPSPELVLGIGASVVLLLSVVLAVVVVRRRRQSLTSSSPAIKVLEANDDDDDNENALQDAELKKNGLQSKDSLVRRGGIESSEGSDASSLLGRVLASASSVFGRNSATSGHESPTNTPQCSADDDDDSLPSNDNNDNDDDKVAGEQHDVVVVMNLPKSMGGSSLGGSSSLSSSVQPLRMPITDEDVESFEAHRYHASQTLRKDMLTAHRKRSMQAFQQQQQQQQQQQRLNPWQSGEIPPSSQPAHFFMEGFSSEDEEAHFVPDDSWDFDDNETTEEDNDDQFHNTFYTSSKQVGKSLLEKYLWRSSDDTPR